MDTSFWYMQPTKVNQHQIIYLNILISPSEIETVIKSLPNFLHPTQEENHKARRFSVEFYQTYKEELTLILLKLFCKIETEGILSNSFHDYSDI